MADERGQTFYHQGAKTPPKPEGGSSDTVADRYTQGIIGQLPHALDLLRGASAQPGAAAPVETTMAPREQLPTARELNGLYQRFRGQARGVLTPEEESELDRLYDGLPR